MKFFTGHLRKYNSFGAAFKVDMGLEFFIIKLGAQLWDVWWRPKAWERGNGHTQAEATSLESELLRLSWLS